MTQKDIAIDFLNKVAFGNVQAGYDLYTASDFVHHNQYFKSDRASLLTAMQEAHESSPNKALDVKYCYEDGDTVITHSLVSKDDMDIVVVHIFRFENHKIAELWDLGQVIDPNSPNELGLF